MQQWMPTLPWQVIHQTACHRLLSCLLVLHTPEGGTVQASVGTLPQHPLPFVEGTPHGCVMHTAKPLPLGQERPSAMQQTSKSKSVAKNTTSQHADEPLTLCKQFKVAMCVCNNTPRTSPAIESTMPHGSIPYGTLGLDTGML